MTIKELMNRTSVTADIEIVVFTCYGDRLIYNGKYEDSIPYVQDLEVWDSDITGITTKEYNPGHYYVTKMTIYADEF